MLSITRPGQGGEVDHDPVEAFGDEERIARVGGHREHGAFAVELVEHPPRRRGEELADTAGVGGEMAKAVGDRARAVVERRGDLDGQLRRRTSTTTGGGRAIVDGAPTTDRSKCGDGTAEPCRFDKRRIAAGAGDDQARRASPPRPARHCDPARTAPPQTASATNRAGRSAGAERAGPRPMARQ